MKQFCDIEADADRRSDGQQIQPKEFGNWGKSMIILFPFGLVPTGITTGILLVDSSPAAWPAHRFSIYCLQSWCWRANTIKLVNKSMGKFWILMPSAPGKSLRGPCHQETRLLQAAVQPLAECYHNVLSGAPKHSSTQDISVLQSESQSEVIGGR